MNDVQTWIVSQLRGGEMVSDLEADAAVLIRHGLLPKVPTVREALRSMERDGVVTVDAGWVRLKPAKVVETKQKSLF